MRRQVGQAALLHGQPQSDRVWLTARDGLIKGPEGVGSRGGQEGERHRAPLQKGSANSGHFGWYSLNILYSRRASVNFTIHRGHADGGLTAALLVLCLLMTYMCRELNSVHFWAYHHCHPVGHTHRYKWPFMWSPWRRRKSPSPCQYLMFYCEQVLLLGTGPGTQYMLHQWEPCSVGLPGPPLGLEFSQNTPYTWCSGVVVISPPDGTNLGQLEAHGRYIGGWKCSRNWKNHSWRGKGQWEGWLEAEDQHPHFTQCHFCIYP